MTPDREHIVTVPPAAMDGLRAWLERPNGAHNVGRVTFEAVAHGGIFVRTWPYGQDAAPERPVSLQHDACGARLTVELYRRQPQTWTCALGPHDFNDRHRAADGTQWRATDFPPTAVPVGTVMDAETQRRLTELERLAAPDDSTALNLGPIIERQRAAAGTEPLAEAASILLRASQRDVMPLVREVMRLRRQEIQRQRSGSDATLRSAVAGFERALHSMTDVWHELLNATCTGCRPVAVSSNPEDGADLETVEGCPVHGEVAELRRGRDWSARQYKRIAAALGPEYLEPFGPDVTAAATRCISTAQALATILRDAGLDPGSNLRGAEELVGQRDTAHERAENCEASISRIADMARTAYATTEAGTAADEALAAIIAECERDDR